MAGLRVLHTSLHSIARKAVWEVNKYGVQRRLLCVRCCGAVHVGALPAGRSTSLEYQVHAYITQQICMRTVDGEMVLR